MNQPRIFISSTCYDLSQIRADINDFIFSVGFQPTLSEYNSFPIDPDNDTLQNCLDNVKTSDILILIVGNRYGFVTDNGKSITNTEYLYAKERGIPVYIFIFKPLITLLKVWKDNKNIDFSNSVESPKVFEFVELLRESNRSWCFEFERAQEIISTLRIQFSHLFKQSLDLRKKYRVSDQPDFYKKLSAKALNLVLLKEKHFELLFFTQVLRDELQKYETLKLDIEYEILTNCSKTITNHIELISWLNINFSSQENFIKALNTLLKDVMIKYWGAPGVPSDLKGLYYIASSVAKIFKELIQWSIEIKSTRVNKEFEVLRNALSNVVQPAIEKIWEYPDYISSIFNDSQAEFEKTGDNKEVQIILKITSNDEAVGIFIEEMQKLKDSI